MPLRVISQVYLGNATAAGEDGLTGPALRNVVLVAALLGVTLLLALGVGLTICLLRRGDRGRGAGPRGRKTPPQPGLGHAHNGKATHIAMAAVDTTQAAQRDDHTAERKKKEVSEI